MVRKIAAIFLILLGMAGFIVPFMPGIPLIIIGALLFSGRDLRAVLRKMRMDIGRMRRRKRE
jgi:uncharacterized protein YqgC (DUF456 family)